MRESSGARRLRGGPVGLRIQLLPKAGCPCRPIGAISLRSITPHPALRATFPRKGGRGSFRERFFACRAQRRGLAFVRSIIVIKFDIRTKPCEVRKYRTYRERAGG